MEVVEKAKRLLFCKSGVEASVESVVRSITNRKHCKQKIIIHNENTEKKAKENRRNHNIRKTNKNKGK